MSAISSTNAIDAIAVGYQRQTKLCEYYADIDIGYILHGVRFDKQAVLFDLFTEIHDLFYLFIYLFIETYLLGFLIFWWILWNH